VRGGPPPLVPALAFGALMIASVVVSAGGPRPDTGAAAALLYVRDHAGQLHAAGFLAFAAALPLALWSAAVYQRLRNLGVVAPGPVFGLTGGILAAASLALSGLLSWTLAEAAPTLDPAGARALVDLSFVTGAAGFVVPLALLIAGVAVPAAILRLTSRPISAIGMLSTFTLLTSTLDPTLPIGRFGGLAWIVAVSLALPASRHRDQKERQPWPATT
jgi:hypothetical protein